MKAKKVRGLRKKEKQRQTFQHITSLFQGSRSPLASLLIPEGDTYTLTTNPDEMNPALCEVNKKQLQASAVSPFVTGALSPIGYDGFSHISNQILDGTIPLIYDDDIIYCLLKHMQIACPKADINFDDSLLN